MGRTWRLLAVALGISIVPLDTAVNIAFPDITLRFGLPIAMIQWVVICYVLTHAALILGFGRAGDIWSHGRVFRAGLLWSTAAFVLCALAPSYGWLLLFRFLQGIGAGLVISCAPALVTGFYPETQRGRALGVFTLIFALGSAVGPLIGGALVQRWGWPAVFWFRAPIALAAALSLREAAAAAPAEREPLDAPGAFFLALGLGGLLAALDRLGARDYAALPLAGAAVASLALFVRRQNRVARPIIALGIFRDPAFALVNLANVVLNLTGFSVLLFVPYYLAGFSSLPLAASGVVLAMAFVGMAAASLPAGRILAYVAPQRMAPFGAFLGGAGLWLVGSWRLDTPVAAIAATLFVQGFGLGLFQVASMEIVMAALPARQRGVAGSLSMLTRTIGIVSGAAGLTALFRAFQSAAVAGGASAADGFLTAFGTTFRLAGLAAAATGLAVMLARPRRSRDSAA